MAAAAVKQFVPLFDRVLVRKLEAVSKSKGGILIPEKAQSKVLEATIVAVGQGSRMENGSFIPPCVKAGDKVMLPEYGGTKIELGDTEYHIYRETDLVAKLE